MNGFLNFLKNFFNILLILVILVGVGAFIFLKTFDANKFLPQITSEIKKSTGRDCTIKNAKLDISLQQGISLVLKDISLAENPLFSEEIPFLQVKQAGLVLDLKALVNERSILIKQVSILSPVIRIIKNKEGVLNVSNFSSTEKPVSGSLDSQTKMPEGDASSSQVPSAAKPEMNTVASIAGMDINGVTIDDVTVTYLDQNVSSPIEVTHSAIAIAVKKLSLINPIVVQKQTASSAESVIGTDMNTFGFKLEGVSLKADMEHLYLRMDSGEKGGGEGIKLYNPKGQLRVDIPEGIVKLNGSCDLNVNIDLSDGNLETNVFPIPVQAFNVMMNASLERLAIQSFLVKVAGGVVNGQGDIDNYLKSPQGTFKAGFSKIDLSQFSKGFKSPVGVEAQSDGDLAITFSGVTPAEISKSLEVDAQIAIGEGSVKGLDVLKNAIDKITMIPGLWPLIEANLSPKTLEGLAQGQTAFEKATLKAHMEGNKAFCDQLNVSSPDFAISGNGKVDLAGPVEFQTGFYFQKDVSAKLIAQAHDLRALQGEDGRIYFPLELKGTLEKIEVSPDVAYLSKKLALDLGVKGLQKILEDKPEAAGILNMFLGKEDGTNSAQDAPVEGKGESAIKADDQEPLIGTESKKSVETKAVESLLDALFEKK